MSEYSIWVLEYGFIPNLSVGTQIYGVHNEGTRKCPFCYVLIKGEGVVAMIDVGMNFNDPTFREKFGVENLRPPKTVLVECGVTPEDVTHIFVTHAHFDHMGGADEFPNATFFIQERELSKWVWAMTLDRRLRWLMAATDPGDIIRAVTLGREGRLRSVSGDVENILPGIDLHAAFDTHTWGSMFVSIRNGGSHDDTWIFAGDIVYCFENLVGRDEADPQYLPVGFAGGSQAELLLATDKMVQLVGGETRRVVPIHEEKLANHFPCRTTGEGLRVFEIALASGEQSCVG